MFRLDYGVSEIVVCCFTSLCELREGLNMVVKRSYRVEWIKCVKSVKWIEKFDRYELLLETKSHDIVKTWRLSSLDRISSAWC